MPHAVKQSAFLERFACLGDACEDTCCVGWGMQVDAATRRKYEERAPELLEAVTRGEAECVMRRDPETDYCVKFDQGWCGVQRSYGAEFLGDACHFFPRATRSLGGVAVMTAALSCPEAARLALFGEDGFAYKEAELPRLPHSLKDYLPPALTPEAALRVHQAFLDAAADGTATPERRMARIASAARSLGRVDVASWPQAAEFYLKNADARLPAPAALSADPFNLLHALFGLIAAAKPTKRPRLEKTLGEMERALAVTLDRATRAIHLSEQSPPAWEGLAAAWEASWAAALRPVLQKWLQAQLAITLFPFSGFGDSLDERSAILGVRFATLRLALMSCCAAHGGVPPEVEIVRVAQSLARFLDHLADPALSLALYAETGWTREARLRALVGDVE